MEPLFKGHKSFFSCFCENPKRPQHRQTRGKAGSRGAGPTSASSPDKRRSTWMRRPLSSSETHEVPSGRRASGHSPGVPAPGSVGQPGASCGRDHHLGVSISFGMVPQGGTTSKGRLGAWLRNLENEHVLFIRNKNVEGKTHQGNGGAGGGMGTGQSGD